MLKIKRGKQKGISSIEIIPVLLVFALLINFSLGFFGVIHSGILNSIAARNYAFETFRNRSNLNRFRDDLSGTENITFNHINYRFHGIIAEKAPPSSTEFYATARAIRFTDENTFVADETQFQDHSPVVQIRDPGAASDVYTGTDGGLNTVWLRTTYGICLNVKCEAAP